MLNGNDKIKMNMLWIVTMNKKQMSGGGRTGGHLFENVSLCQIATGTASGSMGQT